MTRIAIVGIGAMGAMLVRAHYRFDRRQRFKLLAANRSHAPLAALQGEIPGLQTGPVLEVVAASDIVFLCVSPQAYLQATRSLSGVLGKQKLFVSVCSGVPLGELADVLETPVIQVVPSVGHSAGRGAALMTLGPGSTEAHGRLVMDFLQPFAKIWLVEAGDLRAATNITSCGPALIAYFSQAFAAAASPHAESLTSEQLESMTVETLASIAALVDDGWTIERITAAVAASGGITHAGMEALRSGLAPLVAATHQAMADRETERANLLT